MWECQYSMWCVLPCMGSAFCHQAKDPGDHLSPLTSAKSYISESRYSAKHFPANIPWPMTLSYQEDNWFSFSLNFILAQFKFIPAEFKYRRYTMVKNPFLYSDKDRRKKRYVFYVSGKSPNLPIVQSRRAKNNSLTVICIFQLLMALLKINATFKNLTDLFSYYPRV